MSRVSGSSTSYWTSAVEAGVDPRIGPRRSSRITRNPAAVRDSATIAPLIPMPTTSTSVRASRLSRVQGTDGARYAIQTGRPVRRSRARVIALGADALRSAT